MRAALSFFGVLLLSWAASPASAQQFHMERNLDRNLADARLLRNIEPLQTATASLLRLRPVRYQVQSPVSGALLGPLRLGFVAQQLHTVYPGMVLRDYDAKGTLRVEYGQLIPVLTRGFQEQQQRIQTLEGQLGAMNQELVALRAENGRLTVGLATLSAAGTHDNPATASQIAELQRAVRQLQSLVSSSSSVR
ncbi:tail fiber domain-containing protein [Hymenobacter sp. YC55]|uniref:tail fiber domain-containing protein n=1 Tax=Hymenobacter sp. YC55 TaxID=3034019 RepID=UPI0023F7C084|nr:tail fiber domain-containing protein [Hymenobacter sp. YC55]MDF7815273.1 tail fiber domain-containing protein [Hymenobacter sp. YC55]